MICEEVVGSGSASAAVRTPGVHRFFFYPSMQHLMKSGLSHPATPLVHGAEILTILTSPSHLGPYLYPRHPSRFSLFHPSPQYGTNCLASTCHSQYITEATRPEGAQEEPKDMLTALPPLPETSVSRASPVTPIPKDPTPHTEGRLLQGRYTVPHKDFSGNLISAGRFSRTCPSSRREAQCRELKKKGGDPARERRLRTGLRLSGAQGSTEIERGCRLCLAWKAATLGWVLRLGKACVSEISGPDDLRSRGYVILAGTRD